MTQIDMSKLDIRNLNVAIDRLMEVTTNPRHRLMLQAFYRHRFLELAGRYEEIFTPDMMVESPLYRFSYGGPPTILAGTDAVKDQYSTWAGKNETIFYNENEQIAVADNFIASIAPVAFHQLHAKALIENGFDVDDENAYYLHKSYDIQMIWPYDDHCRLIGEDVCEPNPERAELIKLDPEDVLTTEQAAKLLAPLIKPLPPFDEKVHGRTKAAA